MRLRGHRVILNPAKVKLGLQEVEVVGHVINAEGIDFTAAKKNALIELARPQTRQGIKQFLGLANYFRNHVRGISPAMRPLEQLIPGYTKSRSKEPIFWTFEADQAYEFIVNSI